MFNTIAHRMALQYGRGVSKGVSTSCMPQSVGHSVIASVMRCAMFWKLGSAWLYNACPFAVPPRESSLFWCAGLPCQLLSLRTWHTAQAVAAATYQEQDQQGNAFGFGSVFAGLAAGLAATAVGLESHCEGSTYAIAPTSRSWWSRLLQRADPRQLFQNQHEKNIFLEEMQDDPKVC